MDRCHKILQRVVNSTAYCVLLVTIATDRGHTSAYCTATATGRPFDLHRHLFLYVYDML